MKTRLLLLAALMLLAAALSACGRGGATEVTFEQLFADRAKYAGKMVTVEGFYYQGFEVNVLAEELSYSGVAPGHLIPGVVFQGLRRGRMMWVEGGLPMEVYDKLTQQQMLGPTERYGKVRMTGEFVFGRTYGHVGAYDSAIRPSKVELLTWSPPVTPGPGINPSPSARA